MAPSLTRRAFVALAGAGLVVRPSWALQAPAGAGALTARQVVDRIKAQVGVPWNDKTYRDTFKVGNPDQRVMGIASTFMSTFEVIQRAQKAGLNMIVSHEPTFWSDGDVVTDLGSDPLYQEKKAFVEQHGMVVWRFHDHWHARKPDGIFAGWNRALGWASYVDPANERLFRIPASTLGAVASHVAKALESRTVRVIGDPKTPVTTVHRGAHTLAGNMAAMPKVDALLVSEAREWDSIEYARDTVQSGQAKGMILISHEAGEEAGMDECARWLKGFVSEVPVEFVPTRDILWATQA